MNDVAEYAAIVELTKPNLKKRLFVALNYPIKPEPEIVPHLPEHLKYMAERSVNTSALGRTNPEVANLASTSGLLVVSGQSYE